MTAPLIELRGVSKSFGAFQAVNALDLHVGPNEVLGLLGDNGAGKSTTVKLLSGLYQADRGTILVDGRPTTFTGRADSEAAGIETIYQDTALVDGLSITRNIFLGREQTNMLGFLRHAAMRRTAREVLESAVHIAGIDSPDKLVGQLSGGQKQAVAIARALHFKSRVLVLDEPTSALSVRETEALLGYVQRLKGENVSSVFVTHNLYHAYRVCDRFVVMSHGRKVCDLRKADITIEELTEHVVLT